MKSDIIKLTKTGTGRDSDYCEFDRGSSIQCVVTGTATYTVQWSNDDGNNWVDHDTIAGATADASGSFTVPVQMVAVNISSGSGTVDVSVKGS